MSSEGPPGSIFLWRYRENAPNFPGWHLTTDTGGVRSLSDQLIRLRDGPVRATARIPTQRPTHAMLAVPNNLDGLAAWSSPRALVLRVSEQGREWRMSTKNAELWIDCGKVQIAEFLDAVEKLVQGFGDFSIGSAKEDLDDQRLTFWWYPGGKWRT